MMQPDRKHELAKEGILRTSVTTPVIKEKQLGIVSYGFACKIHTHNEEDHAVVQNSG